MRHLFLERAGRDGRHIPFFLILLLLFVLIGIAVGMAVPFRTNAGSFIQQPDRYWAVNPMNPMPSGGDGEIAHCTLESQVLKEINTVGFNIYLPPAYETDTDRRFPVIYLLHGVNGDENNYFSFFDGSIFNAVSIVREIEQRPAGEQAIVVWVNGGKASFYNDFVDATGYGPSSDFPILSETVIMQDVIPFVDANFRTIPNRTGRAIEGFSMGGRGALKLAFKYPDQFCSTISYGGAAYESIAERFAPTHPAIGEHRPEDKISNIVAQNASAIITNDLGIWLVDGDRDGTGNDTGRSDDLTLQLDQLNIPQQPYISDLPNTEHHWGDYHQGHVSDGYDFHTACFAEAENRLAQQQPINAAFALLGSMDQFAFLPFVNVGTPGSISAGSCE